MPPEIKQTDSEILRLLADYCSLKVIDLLRGGAMRFSEIHRALGDANPVTLTDRLKKLETAGFVLREAETLDKQSVLYSLSRTGQAALPIIKEFCLFSQKLKKGEV